MPFIGNQPALSYTSFAKQDFTTSATTSYTLDQPVANANELALFINFVRQEPTTAYTASGTTLTLTSATSASDDMYCVFLGKAVQTVNPPNSSVGTSQLDSSLDFSSKTITLASNMKNTPGFLVTKSASQTVNATTSTLITWDSETIDTDNNFASNKFTPTTAGYYLFNVIVGGGQNDDMTVLTLKKNGSTTYYLFDGDVTDAYAVGGSITLYANGTSDYFEVFLYHGGTGTKAVNSVSHWSGFKLIGV